MLDEAKGQFEPGEESSGDQDRESSGRNPPRRLQTKKVREQLDAAHQKAKEHDEEVASKAQYRSTSFARRSRRLRNRPANSSSTRPS